MMLPAMRKAGLLPNSGVVGAPAAYYSPTTGPTTPGGNSLPRKNRKEAGKLLV